MVYVSYLWPGDSAAQLRGYAWRDPELCEFRLTARRAMHKKEQLVAMDAPHSLGRLCAQ